VSSRGKSFGALARYPVHGRTGQEADRIAWTASRNLPSAEPELGATMMRYTAAQNARVERPVYHLVISFHPGDRVNRATMERVADRVLDRLGLREYQVVMVAHRDRAHPHVHLMVNRVHPEAGRAWDRAFDYRVIREVLREQERDLGLRSPGDRRPRDVEGEPSNTSRWTPGEWRQQQRTGTEPLVGRVRTLVPELRAATSWGELEGALARHGLRLIPKGQGFVISDGGRQVKASRVARELSRHHLEHRFGVQHVDRNRPADRVRPVGLRPVLSPTARYVAVKLSQYERALRLHHAVRHAEELVRRAESRLAGYDTAVRHARGADADFDRQLAHMYRDPAHAKMAYLALAGTRGASVAHTTLRTHPERLGALHVVAQRRWLGLSRTEDESGARRAGMDAARSAEAREAAWAKIPTVDERQAAERLQTHRMARADRLRRARDLLSDRAYLARDLGRAMMRLKDKEWTAFAATLAPRRAALGDALRDAAREAARAQTLREMAAGAAREALHAGGQVLRAAERYALAELVSKNVHRAFAQLAPAELRQLRTIVLAVRAPHRAVLHTVRRTIKEAMLGKDGLER
jgi:hypothetical protein